NDGTLFKVTPTVDRFGNSNKAYLFDGDSSHIALPSNMLDKQAMTISMWFKTTAGGTGVLVGQQNVPIYQSGLANWTPILYVRQDGQLHASFWNGSNSNENDSTFLVNDDMWHHVVITGDASGQDVYIDNVLCGTGTGIQVLSNVIYNYIGNAPAGSFWPSTPGGYFSFDGTIDDVHIYNRKLCPLAVNKLYNASNPATTGVVAVKKELAFNIYPNPATNQLNIETDATIESIEIYSLVGKLVQREKTASFSVQNLENGAYILRAKTNKGLVHKRFIKGE
ncbi:MAG: T9SS type A sorting domain-containing protein, partial [Aureispira sp.]|nr:T9SS type A sorting domain-containing protein [Aureispira sp.]